MSQQLKWKIFYNPETHDINEIIANAEEELLKEEMSEHVKRDLSNLISGFEDGFYTPTIFFEDKGIVYGLSDNLNFYNKLSQTH